MSERVINDILYFTRENRKKAYKIVSLIDYRLSCKDYTKFLVGLTSVSGNGKSEATLQAKEILLDEYDIKSSSLKLDECYKVRPELRESVRKETGDIGRSEINKRDVYNYIADFREGKVLKHIKVLIIEGLYAIEPSYNLDLKIFLEGNIESTKEFRLLRKKEPQTEFRQKVLEIEQKEVFSLRKYADVVI